MTNDSPLSSTNSCTPKKDPQDFGPKPFRDIYYFFYGRLMDPSTLAQALDLPPGRLPEIHAAYMGKYPIKMWDKFPAIVGGHDTPYQRVSGVVYKVTSKEEMDRLAKYMSHNYRLRGCRVHLEDAPDTRVRGATFVCDEDPSLLSEGSFDLENWLERKNQTDREKSG